MQTDPAELVHTIEHLQGTFEDLCVRGLRSAGPAEINKLNAIREEFDRIGAGHLAQRIGLVLDGIRNNDRKAAAALMKAQATLRVFERILTLESVSARLAILSALDRPDEDGSESAGYDADGEGDDEDQ